MLSYAHGADDRPLIGQTIGDFFDAISETHAGHEALVSCHQGIRWTYGELRDRVDELGRALLALGTHKGDRVGIWSPNHAEWVVTQFATAKIGAILVNINPAYRVHELEYALQAIRLLGADHRAPIQNVELRGAPARALPGTGAVAAGPASSRATARAADGHHVRTAAARWRLSVGGCPDTRRDSDA